MKRWLIPHFLERVLFTLLSFLTVALSVSSVCYALESIEQKFVEGQVIVKLRDGVLSEKLLSVKQELGAMTVKKFPSIGAELWEMTSETATAMKLLSEDSRFEYVEPNYIYSRFETPNDPDFSQLWGLEKIAAPKAWDIAKGGDIIIAVIDTGVDYNHPDLADNMWTNPNEVPNNGIDDDSNGYIDDYYGYDFAYNDSDPFDGDSHGTHVAGTIAAVGNNGIGVVGVNWSAKIMAIKFLDDGGLGSTIAAISAIEYATKMGAKISNNSWGGGDYSQALYDAIRVAGEKEHLFVAAAGNSATNNDDQPHYPSSYKRDNIIAVAATDKHDELANFSCYGQESVDLGAPGTSIYSTVPNNKYKHYQGTSMAAPHVSGAIGLLWAAFPNLTSTTVKEMILSSVDEVPALSGKTVTGGRLNVFKAFPPNLPPTADFKYEPKSGPAPLELRLDGSASYDPDGSITHHEWQMTGPDSQQASGKKPTITLTAPGDYDITLTVTDDKGSSDTKTVTQAVTVDDNIPPDAFFTISPSAGCAPLTVVLNAAKSKDEDGTIVNYSWFSSDGHEENGQKTSMLFNVKGSYDITLTVTDDGEKTDSENKSVDVCKNPRPLACFEFFPDDNDPFSVKVDGSCSFDSNGFIEAYRWTSSAEHEASGSQTTMKFAEEGQYYIDLTVKDDGGQESKARRKVFIGAPIAKLKVSPTSGYAPLTVALDGTESYARNNGSIKDYKWTSDKGLEASGSTATVVLKEIGVHRIELTVTDNTGLKNKNTETETVKVIPPLAACFTKVPDSGQAPLTVILDASCSEGDIEESKWTSDRGLNESGVKITTFLTELGTHTITLTVNDSLDLSHSVQKTVIVTENELNELINLSTRAPIEGGANDAIAGFIITGIGEKKVILRGWGLESSVNPKLTVQKYPGGEFVASNDNWQQSPRANEIKALPAHLQLSLPTDAGLLLNLPVGAYTVILSSVNKKGLGLVGVDDAIESTGAQVPLAKLINLSTRAPIRGGAYDVIAGFIIDGTGTQKVLLRGWGLEAGVDPKLTVQKYPSGDDVASNDNWLDGLNASDIAALPAHLQLSKSTDAGLLLELPAGAYTAILSSGGIKGLGLIGVDAID